jgi:hypothetical protein
VIEVVVGCQLSSSRLITVLVLPKVTAPKLAVFVPFPPPSLVVSALTPAMGLAPVPR